MRSARPAVFLGRDSVFHDARGELRRPEDLAWPTGAAHALRALRRAGWLLVLVSNQPGIARGLFGPAAYDNLVSALHADLARHGAALDSVYHCPHLPDAPLAAWRCQCACRLPAPGLLRRAARDLDIDLQASLMLGEQPRDIQAGRTAGLAACILVGTDTGQAAPGDGEPGVGVGVGAGADANCADLAQAAHWVLEHAGRLHA